MLLSEVTHPVTAMPYPGIVMVQAPTPYQHPPADPGRAAYTMWLEGWDGTNWSLSDPQSGLVLMRGARGIGGITVEHFRDDHAYLPGSRWRGFRAQNRELFLPLHIYSDGSSAEWVEHNRKFTRIFRSGKTVWLHIVHPNGAHRKIEARYEKGFEDAFELDPAFYGGATYGLTLLAEQPYWEGAEPFHKTWVAPQPLFFFGGQPTSTGVEASGPPFGVTDDRTLGSAVVTNDGDTETWPVWALGGPFDSAAVGIGSHVILVPFAVAAGHVLVIDARPHAQTAMLNGVTNKTDLLGSFDFYPIPSGNDISVEAVLTGGGAGAFVSVDIVRLYEWGIS